MWGRSRLGVGTAALVLGAVVLTAGCGEKTVTFQPVDGPGSTTTAPSSSSPPAPASSTAPAGATTDPDSGIVITRNGNTVCVKGRNGGQACTSGSGTVVVDGVTVSNGVVVSGGNGVTVTTTTPTPTSGQVSLSGAVTWSGKATGTCDGHGTGVRTVTAELPGVGRLVVNSVGGGVVRISLTANGSPYGLNHVGSNGPVSTTGDRLVIDGARLGRGGNVVVLDGDFDC